MEQRKSKCTWWQLRRIGGHDKSRRVLVQAVKWPNQDELQETLGELSDGGVLTPRFFKPEDMFDNARRSLFPLKGSSDRRTWHLSFVQCLHIEFRVDQDWISYIQRFFPSKYEGKRVYEDENERYDFQRCYE